MTTQEKREVDSRSLIIEHYEEAFCVENMKWAVCEDCFLNQELKRSNNMIQTRESKMWIDKAVLCKTEKCYWSSVRWSAKS